MELTDLVSIGFEVDGPVAQVGESTWAIYGHSSYDGEIIVGEYPDADEASEVLRAAPHLDPAPRLDRDPTIDPGIAPS